MEIERKFLIDELPSNISQFKSSTIKQGYISSNPVIRIRQLDHDFILTIKTINKLGLNTLLARDETEIEITKEEFDNLQKIVKNNTIFKTRYFIPLENNLTAELDVYHENLTGLLTVEVEFDSIKDAESFISPKWFGKDVTFDKKFSNSNLAKHGI